MSDTIYELAKGLAEAASEPLCKLIDAVRAGVGLVYDPIHVRRIARAEADALIIRTEAQEITLDTIAKRTVARIANIESRRQENIETVVEEAAKALPKSVSADTVDPDWTASFFDCCKDVSDGEMQKLFAQILAGEVSKPGRFSRRTLEAMKTLSRHEATLFRKLCQYVWEGREIAFVVTVPHEDAFLKEHDFSRDDLAMLTEAGLLSFGLASQSLEPSDSEALAFKGTEYRVSNPKMAADIPVSILTATGKELFQIADAGETDHEYLRLCKAHFDEVGIKLIDSPDRLKFATA